MSYVGKIISSGELWAIYFKVKGVCKDVPIMSYTSNIKVEWHWKHHRSIRNVRIYLRYGSRLLWKDSTIKVSINHRLNLHPTEKTSTWCKNITAFKVVNTTKVDHEHINGCSISLLANVLVPVLNKMMH